LTQYLDKWVISKPHRIKTKLQDVFLVDKDKLTPINPKKRECGAKVVANGAAFTCIAVTRETWVQWHPLMENELRVWQFDDERKRKTWLDRDCK
jgi:hypothetical protein